MLYILMLDHLNGLYFGLSLHTDSYNWLINTHINDYWSSLAPQAGLLFREIISGIQVGFKTAPWSSDVDRLATTAQYFIKKTLNFMCSCLLFLNYECIPFNPFLMKLKLSLFFVATCVVLINDTQALPMRALYCITIEWWTTRRA